MQLPPELWLEVKKYRQIQRDYAPIGAVPAYQGTYFEYLEGFRPLRQEIQRYITSCEGLKIRKIRRVRPEYVLIRGVAVTQWGDEAVFLLRIYRKDISRLAKELEEMVLGQRDNILFKESENIYVARIYPPSIGMLVFPRPEWSASWSHRPPVVQYCREVIEAITEAMRLVID